MSKSIAGYTYPSFNRNVGGRCYETHKPLPIGSYLLYGGSGSSPIVLDADVYVGFDHSVYCKEKGYPWNDGYSFLFPIPDMGIPANPEEFIKLVEWLSLQLIANKKVHIGCIGGHGRTGMVMSALVKVMTGEVDAITYVRNNYCHKAVESKVQVDFLVKHFGITQVKGAKEVERILTPTYQPAPIKKSDAKKESKGKSIINTTKNITTLPVTTQKYIWGNGIKFDKL